MNSKIRLVKIISHSGICSRRQAENLIKDGKVKLDGKPYTNHLLEEKNISRLTVNNYKLYRIIERLWCFHKSSGLVCSNKNQFGSQTIFDIIPKKLPRMLSVGRLDKNSEGLLLLTNSPTLSSFLEHPKNEIERKYSVKINGKLKIEELHKFQKNLNIDGVKYKSRKIKIIRNEKNLTKLEIILKQGKNREIRKIMAHFNFNVLELKRIEYGPFKLLKLKKNKVIEIPKKILTRKLKEIGFKNENYFWKV